MQVCVILVISYDLVMSCSAGTYVVISEWGRTRGVLWSGAAGGPPAGIALNTCPAMTPVLAPRQTCVCGNAECLSMPGRLVSPLLWEEWGDRSAPPPGGGSLPQGAVRAARTMAAGRPIRWGQSCVISAVEQSRAGRTSHSAG